MFTFRDFDSDRQIAAFMIYDFPHAGFSKTSVWFYELNRCAFLPLRCVKASTDNDVHALFVRPEVAAKFRPLGNLSLSP